MTPRPPALETAAASSARPTVHAALDDRVFDAEQLGDACAFMMRSFSSCEAGSQPAYPRSTARRADKHHIAMTPATGSGTMPGERTVPMAGTWSSDFSPCSGMPESCRPRCPWVLLLAPARRPWLPTAGPPSPPIGGSSASRECPALPRPRAGPGLRSRRLRARFLRLARPEDAVRGLARKIACGRRRALPRRSGWAVHGVRCGGVAWGRSLGVASRATGGAGAVRAAAAPGSRAVRCCRSRSTRVRSKRGAGGGIARSVSPRLAKGGRPDAATRLPSRGGATTRTGGATSGAAPCSPACRATRRAPASRCRGAARNPASDRGAARASPPPGASRCRAGGGGPTRAPPPGSIDRAARRDRRARA